MISSPGFMLAGLAAGRQRSLSRAPSPTPSDTSSVLSTSTSSTLVGQAPQPSVAGRNASESMSRDIVAQDPQPSVARRLSSLWTQAVSNVSVFQTDQDILNRLKKAPSERKTRQCAATAISALKNLSNAVKNAELSDRQHLRQILEQQRLALQGVESALERIKSEFSTSSYDNSAALTEELKVERGLKVVNKALERIGKLLPR